MLVSILNGIINIFSTVLNVILSLLPNSPFNWSVINDFKSSAWFQIVNYFIPFSAMLTTLEAYVSAVLIWYMYRWVLRFVKYIG
jgi:hypothetical protein